MKKLRALVVVHASLVPPESLEGHTDKEIEEWRTEYDVTSTLRAGGHDVRCIGVLDSLTCHPGQTIAEPAHSAVPATIAFLSQEKGPAALNPH